MSKKDRVAMGGQGADAPATQQLANGQVSDAVRSSLAQFRFNPSHGPRLGLSPASAPIADNDVRLQRLVANFPGTPLSVLKTFLQQSQVRYAPPTLGAQGARPAFPLGGPGLPAGPPLGGAAGTAGIAADALAGRGTLTFARPRVAAGSGNGRKRQARSESESDASPSLSSSSSSDSEDLNEESGSDYGDAEADAASRREAVLAFFNDSTPQLLQDGTGCSLEQAETLVGLRPFSSLAHLERELGETRGVSARLIESYSAIMSGYRRVDRLISECDAVGKRILAVVRDWRDDILHGCVHFVHTGASAAAAGSSGDTAVDSEVADTCKLPSADANGVSEAVQIDADPKTQQAGAHHSDSESDDSDAYAPSDASHSNAESSPSVSPTRSAAAKQYPDATRHETPRGLLLQQPEVVPAELALKDYQLVGVSWLTLLWRQGISGILADDMGLGKTAQVVCFLGYLLMQGEAGPHIVVVPASTLDNWLREFARWCPALEVRAYRGNQSERAAARAQLQAERGSFHVVVTTYNLATSVKEDRVFFTKRLRAASLILDEGHLVKNAQAARHRNLMAIPVRFRLLLTGTPLQNNLRELMALLSFIVPALFGGATEEAIARIFSGRSGARQDASNQLSKQRIQRAKRMMAPFVLRRKKVDVLSELPAKREQIVYCDMTDEQRVEYQTLLDSSRTALMEQAAEAAEATATKRPVIEAPKRAKRTAAGEFHGIDDRPPTPPGKGAEPKKRLSNVLVHLRKMADHPLLFRKRYTDDKIAQMARAVRKEADFSGMSLQEREAEFALRSDFELHQLCLYYEPLHAFKLGPEAWLAAGKVQKLKQLLQEHRARGDRVLLFSQFTRLLDILEAVLHTLGHRFLRLDGTTPVAERQQLIDTFNADQEVLVFLLSTKAAGTGINLASANVVILYDLDYNPHNDAQAADRAHRVGQVRDVTVTKLVQRGTIDEWLLSLGEAKLKLEKHLTAARGGITGLESLVVPGGDAEGSSGGSGDPSDLGEADDSQAEATAETQLGQFLTQSAAV